MSNPLSEWDGEGMSIMPIRRAASWLDDPSYVNSYTVAERAKMNLAAAVARHVAIGWRVESRSENQAILVSGKNVNHLLHAIITLFTCGFWGLIWIILACVTHEQRMTLTVDQYGNVHRSTPATSY